MPRGAFGGRGDVLGWADKLAAAPLRWGGCAAAGGGGPRILGQLPCFAGGPAGLQLGGIF
jgi:hypothetical protein